MQILNHNVVICDTILQHTAQCHLFLFHHTLLLEEILIDPTVIETGIFHRHRLVLTYLTTIVTEWMIVIIIDQAREAQAYRMWIDTDRKSVV